MKKWLFRLASRIVPKKNGYWVFMPIHNRNRFTGNIRALALYTKKHKDNVAVVVENDKMKEEVDQYGLKTLQGEFTKYWHLLRAGKIIIDGHPSLFQGGNFSFIQLWHGTGFKNIGLTRLIHGKNQKKRIQDYQENYLNCQFVVATSNYDVERKNASFGKEKAIVIGSPRNDLFFQNQTLVKKYQQKYGLDQFDKVISYTPTYRDFQTSAPFTTNFWKKLQAYLERENAVFVIKKHPWDKFLKVPKAYKNIQDLSKEITDVQELLIVTDLLITDYSGIMTDFAITNRPILLYTYDLEKYVENCRSFYYDIEKVLPRPFIKTEQSLLDKLNDLSWTETQEYKNSYKDFREMFHTYFDGNSSKRVFEAIEKNTTQ